jgi:hypothetical protein
VVQSLDRHVPSISRGRARRSRPTVLASWTWLVGMKTVEHVSANLEVPDMPPLTNSQYAQFFE